MRIAKNDTVQANLLKLIKMLRFIGSSLQLSLFPEGVERAVKKPLQSVKICRLVENADCWPSIVERAHGKLRRYDESEPLLGLRRYGPCTAQRTRHSEPTHASWWSTMTVICAIW